MASQPLCRLGYLAHLAFTSAWNRRATLCFIVFSIALSTTLLLGIERIRTQMRDSFVQSVSGVDLVVGARGSSVQLVLYALFHLGSGMNTVSEESAKKIAADPRVAWTIPISLGDYHKSYPVVATNTAMFTHFRYRNKQSLRFASGQKLQNRYDVVLGSEVAKNLGYSLGHSIVVSHGDGHSAHNDHSDSPFTVCGILESTGTPVDRSLYISLDAMTDLHANFGENSHEHEHEHKASALNAVLVGLANRSNVFAVQQSIAQEKSEALMAVLPGVAMNQIWDMLHIGENALFFISCMVTVVGLFGLAAAILAGLGERRRELAILRSCGASPFDILLLLLFEGCMLVVTGIVFGVLLLYALEFSFLPLVADRFGLFLEISLPTLRDCLFLVSIAIAGLVSSMIPAFRAYKMSLADGLTVSV